MLSKIFEIHEPEDWEILSTKGFRFEGKEEYMKGETRVTFFDPASGGYIFVYTETSLLPENPFWEE